MKIKFLFYWICTARILQFGNSIHFWVGVLFVSLTASVCLVYAWIKKLL